jgi:hypothetical protein
MTVLSQPTSELYVKGVAADKDPAEEHCVDHSRADQTILPDPKPVIGFRDDGKEEQPAADRNQDKAPRKA